MQRRYILFLCYNPEDLNAMRKLYVIGNGFDLYHGLNTRYQTFACHLTECNSELFELLNTYYGLPDIRLSTTTDEEYGMWSRFEEILADLDYNTVLDDHSDLIANPSAEDFRDRDWHSYQKGMEMIMTRLTSELKTEFTNFILGVLYHKDVDSLLLDLDPKSTYFNFNYTETLQRYYNIKSENIFYVHNKAEPNNDSIVLGHGTDPDSFKEPEEEAPEGLTEDELDEWKEHQADNYDYSYESAKQEILGYYFASFKNTEKIIADNMEFFGSLRDVTTIYILGHSLSQVDIRYICKLKESTSDDVNWIVTYYSESEKKQHLSALLELDILEKNIKQIMMMDLKFIDKAQYKLDI